MAKRKAANKAKDDETKVNGAEATTSTTTTVTEKAKGGNKQKTAAEQKPPAQPFGDVLPAYSDRGSPADGNWKPSGDPERDIAALESQERFLFRIMVRAKHERDVAKATAKLILAQAEETSVTDGFPVAEKISLHKKADTSETQANKADKQYKRARDGWNAIKCTIHQYLTEGDKPLFEQPSKKGKAA